MPSKGQVSNSKPRMGERLDTKATADSPAMTSQRTIQQCFYDVIEQKFHGTFINSVPSLLFKVLI